MNFTDLTIIITCFQSDNKLKSCLSTIDKNIKVIVVENSNRNEFKKMLKKNNNRNALDINYWNYNLIIDSYSKETNKDFENSFIKLFFLTKNNQDKNLDLKKYFVTNYNYFSEKNKKIILNNY